MQVQSITSPLCPEGAQLISLTKGAFAIVDAEDYEWLSQRKWCISGNGYATRGSTVDGKHRNVRMHREIMGFPASDVDHINRNRLDNRRSNLRLASQKDNRRNVGKRESKGSRFKGVRPENQGHWAARITVDGVSIHLGTYDAEEDAARAYDAALLHYTGLTTGLNFPGETLSLEEALSRRRDRRANSG